MTSGHPIGRVRERAMNRSQCRSRLSAKMQAGKKLLRHHGRVRTIWSKACPAPASRSVASRARKTRPPLERWRSAIVGDALPHLRSLVLETGATAEAGGTGVPNDWNTVREARAGGWFKGLPPIIAAGGLRPGTVGDVVLTVRPWAVD